MKKLQPIFDKRFPLPQLWIGLFAMLFFIPYLGHVHLFDWDEINFAESAREMLITGNYFQVQINFEPFWEKPPLFFWLQILSMKVFGITAFAARFPNAIFGIITLLTLYQVGKKHFSHLFGMIWVLLYAGSLLPFMYFRSGIIDPVFNYFIFVGLYFLALSLHEKSKANQYAALSGSLIGLAILTKGPVAILIVIIVFLAYWAGKKFQAIGTLKSVLLLTVCCMLVSSAWFGLELIKNGPWFLLSFIKYQIRLFTTPGAGHSQPFYYHFVVVFLGCFPMSLFGVKPLIASTNYSKLAAFDFYLWMKILFWTVMILFSITTTKIVHYSSLAYFPLSFLATLFIYEKLRNKKAIKKSLAVAILIMGGFYAIIFSLLPIILMQKAVILQFVKKEFALNMIKSAELILSGYEWLIGVFFAMILIATFLLLLKGRIRRPLLILCLGSALSFTSISIWVLPQIEAYSQGVLINYFKEKAGEDIYIRSVGFKTYAQYFYFQLPPYGNEQARDVQWLLKNPADKDIYFITKPHLKDQVEYYDDIYFVEEVGGYLVYKKDKK